MLPKITTLVFVLILAWITETHGDDSDVSKGTSTVSTPLPELHRVELSTEKQLEETTTVTKLSSKIQHITEKNKVIESTTPAEKIQKVTKNTTPAEKNHKVTKNTTPAEKIPKGTKNITPAVVDKLVTTKTTEKQYSAASTSSTAVVHSLEDLVSLFPDVIPTQELPVHPSHPNEHFEALPPVYNKLPIQTPFIPLLKTYTEPRTMSTTEKSYPNNVSLLTTIVTSVKHKPTPTSENKLTQTAYAKPVTKSVFSKVTSQRKGTPSKPITESSKANEISNKDENYITNPAGAITPTRYERPNKNRRPSTQQVTFFSFPQFTKSKRPYFGHKIITNKDVSTTKFQPETINKSSTRYFIQNEINKGTKSRYPSSKNPTVKWVNISQTRPMTATSLYYVNTRKPMKKRVTNRVSHRNRYRPSTKYTQKMMETTLKSTLSTQRPHVVNSHHHHNTKPRKATTQSYEINTGLAPSNLHEKPNFEIHMNSQMENIHPMGNDFPIMMSGGFKPNFPPTRRHSIFMPHKMSPMRSTQNYANIVEETMHTTHSQENNEQIMMNSHPTTTSEKVTPFVHKYQDQYVENPHKLVENSRPTKRAYTTKADMPVMYQPMSEKYPFYRPITMKPNQYLHEVHKPTRNRRPTTRRTDNYFRPSFPSHQSKQKYPTSYVISLNAFRKPH